MPEFRAFKLYQGGVEEAINLDCGEAEERARKLATDGPVELWQGARLIARYEASGTARARALLKRRDWLTIAWGLMGGLLCRCAGLSDLHFILVTGPVFRPGPGFQPARG